MLWIEAVKKCSIDLKEPFELEFVWRHLNNLTKLDWLNLQREVITDKEFEKLSEIAKRLILNEPPQYIVGWAEFFDLKFKVDKRVLIPRPETQELVEMLLKNHPSPKTQKSLLDIGTGSGAIAVSIAKNRPNWSITASDLSDEVLAVANENSKTHQVMIDLIKSDVFDSIHQKFDLIISNPPYIAFDETYEMDESVIKFEPDTALFAANDGLAIYEKIAAQAPSHLTERGEIYLEIGYKQGQSVKLLFEKAFPAKKVCLHQDIFGKDRMISVTDKTL